MLEDVKNDIDLYYQEVAEGVFDQDEESKDQDMNEVQVDAILHVIEKENERISEINSQAKEQIDKIKQWQESIIEKRQKRIDRLTETLYAFFLHKKNENPTVKTISFPNGTLKARKQQPLLIIEDRDEFFRALGDKQELVRVVTKYDPDKKAIMKYIKETGEVPQGVSLESRDDKFIITTGG
jgi:hypothetical protein|tara:strand:+ start:1739 stop:2284 length:546 start_codon:yes stop_codon:yes gene_type:complete